MADLRLGVDVAPQFGGHAGVVGVTQPDLQGEPATVSGRRAVPLRVRQGGRLLSWEYEAGGLASPALCEVGVIEQSKGLRSDNIRKIAYLTYDHCFSILDL